MTEEVAVVALIPRFRFGEKWMGWAQAVPQFLWPLFPATVFCKFGHKRKFVSGAGGQVSYAPSFVCVCTALGIQKISVRCHIFCVFCGPSRMLEMCIYTVR